MSNEPTRTATITLLPSQWATLEPVVPELHEALGRRAVKFALGGPLGHQTVGVFDYTLTNMLHRWVLDKGADGPVRVPYQQLPQGLVPPVADWLSARGYTVSVQDERSDSERWERDVWAYARLWPRQQALADAVAQNRCLRVVARKDRSIADAIKVVAKVYDQARIAVGVTSKGMLRRIRRHLTQALDEPLGMYTASRRVPGRVSVGLITQLPREEFGYYDLLVLPYAEKAVGDKALDIAQSAQFRRILAFTPAKEIRDDNIAWRMNMVAGAVWPPIAPQPPIAAVLLNAHGTRPTQMANAYEEKRDLYWMNDRRNHKVAEVAKRLAAKKKKPILAMVGNAELANKMIAAAKSGVAILVETPVHARELAKLLPGWIVYTDADVDVVDPPAGAQLIITEMATAGAVPTAGVLVRATGTRWPLAMTDWPNAETGLAEAVLVDFTDKYHPKAAHYAESRAKSYAEAGMTIWTATAMNTTETHETMGAP